ncbi:hypothetical protein C8J56DRAFT_306347 [Mycena floridula]|nr:hypothetical protein C8J56DRAFT_306347 [Mycena floridula]
MPKSASEQHDVASRKRKNAEAQAAFRARRANYIATLEETVTNLESVVLQLQDSCRESRTEAQTLRQENVRLKQELREREVFWRAVCSRKAGQGSDNNSDDLPPPSASFSGMNGHGQVNQYATDGLSYRAHDPTVCNGQFNNAAHAYNGHSSSLSYPDGGDINQRLPKYTSYFHPTRDWPQSITQSSSSGADSGVPPASSHSSDSPNFSQSPHVTTSSDMTFVARFPSEDQKIPLTNIETTPYIFSASRSISPSNTPPSATLTSSFPFPYPDGASSSDRSEFDYRRQAHSHSPQVTLHGGTADISIPSSGPDGLRYRLGTRRSTSGADHSLLPVLPPLSGSDTGSQHERGSSDGDSHPSLRLRLRRGNGHSRSSRSPSPGTAPQLPSSTLAVIKAQSFGALRRTRISRKSEHGAAKVALDVLEARGIGLGVQTGSNKRPRLDDDPEGHS